MAAGNEVCLEDEGCEGDVSVRVVGQDGEVS